MKKLILVALLGCSSKVEVTSGKAGHIDVDTHDGVTVRITCDTPIVVTVPIPLVIPVPGRGCLAEKP